MSLPEKVRAEIARRKDEPGVAEILDRAVDLFEDEQDDFPEREDWPEPTTAAPWDNEIRLRARASDLIGAPVVFGEADLNMCRWAVAEIDRLRTRS